MQSREQLYLEAEKIAQYLLRVSPAEDEKQAYADAVQKLNIQLDGCDALLWEEMLRSRSRMGYIDAGLALRDPQNLSRRKLFTMLAILEASPHHTAYFLSRDFSFWYFFKVGLVGMRAIFRGMIGVITVNNIRMKCS